jgi:hypothetical protein
MVRPILCLAALVVTVVLTLVATGSERVSEAIVDSDAPSDASVAREAVLTASTDEESAPVAGDIANSLLGAYNNLGERRLLGLGILLQTLIIAILLAWKMPMKRNVWNASAGGNFDRYYQHYAPPENAKVFGLPIRNEVEAWRAANAKKIANKADANLKNDPEWDRKRVHPRIVARVIEQGAWIDADDVQELWGGLLASSCSFDGSDDSNLTFVDLLSHLSLSEARILNYICENTEKRLSPTGWLTATSIEVSIGELQEISKTSDAHKLYLGLTHLRTLGLLRLNSDLKIYSASADLEPTNLALQMYARCHGYSGDLITFFGNLVTLNAKGTHVGS